VVIATGSAPRLLPGDARAPLDDERTSCSRTSPSQAADRAGRGSGGGGVRQRLPPLRERGDHRRAAAAPLALEDEDISAEFEKAFRKRKIKALTNAKLETVDIKNELVKATVTTSKGTEVLEGDLSPLRGGQAPGERGRRPAEVPNIKVERGFVIIDPKTLLTGESWVSAIGDVVAIPGRSHPQLAHLAFVEGEFVADRLAGKKAGLRELRPGARRHLFRAGGCLHRAHRESGQGAGVQGEYRDLPFAANGKARILNLPEGMVKVVAEEKYDEVLGVHIIGPGLPS